MSESSKQPFTLPPDQQAIRDKCFHPSGTFVQFPTEDIETSIPARFEKIVRRYPERVAIRFGGERVTYSALDTMANRFAHALITERNIGEEPIGLLFQKNTQAIAAMLGVLKAGKFFVPLDPGLPTPRITALLEDCGAAVVFTDHENSKAAKELANERCRFISFEELETHPGVDTTQVHTPPQAFAFLAFTSGSTGKPKGVIQTHRNVLAAVMRYANLLRICPEDRVALLPAWSSNAIQVIMITLLNGATLLPYDVQSEGVGELANWLCEEEITCSWINSALFRNLCGVLTNRNSFPSLRLLRVTTEFYKSDVELYKTLFSPNCIIARGYSSSETSQTRTLLIDHDSEFTDGDIPVGYALEGIDVSLIDEKGEIVGFNTIGEILVKSPYLSPGYWRNPELTAESYRTFPNDSDERVYLSGDLGLLLPDGNLIYKGRKDFQVKIRGYNVSLAEIEKTILEHPAVQQTGVVAWEQRNNEKSLVAYVVTGSHSMPKSDELRRFLAGKLPDYMIPSTFVPMESLPMRNGKLDREALPKPGGKRPDVSQPYAPPQNEIQRQLAEIWEETIAIYPIGIHDDFFDLGGHSLLAMRILTAVNDGFGVDMSMRNLLDAPTVAGLAEQIEYRRAIGGQARLPTPARPLIAPSSQGGVLPLSYAEEGLWLLEQLQPGMSAWNMQSRFRLRGSINSEALQSSLNTLIQRHETLRTAYRLVNGKPVRVIIPELTVELKTTQVDSSLDTEIEIERISMADEKQPFAIAEAPLFRIRLVRVNAQDHVLIVTKHHIITDAWSSNVFSKELFSLYDAYTKNRPSALAELPLQYSDYALWMRQSEQDPMADQLSYWREKLEGCAVQEIPMDARRTPERSHRGGQERFQLSREHSRALGELSKEERSTHFMLLVAAFKILLSRYTGSSDIVVGSALAGRNRTELANLIGMFINILPLRTNLSGKPTFRELLRRVRETCLEAYQHQNIAFEKLVQTLNPGQGLNHNPFFQVLFNVVNAPSAPLAVDHLTIESMPRPGDTARFDLSIYAPQNDVGIEVIAAYNRNLFNKERIVEMLQQYKYLLEQIVDNPDQTIDQYSLVTPSAERLLPDPSLTLDDTWQGAVHDLIARHAERRPEKAALEDSSGVWSYRELNDRSNQIAHWLIAQGVKRGDIVAVYGQRSAALVSALLGILKAGTAFCVIDPKHPAGRVRAYLSGTDPKAFIEIGGEDKPNAELEEDLRGASLHSRLFLPGTDPSKLADILSQCSTENPQVNVGPDDLAYIIFTSGSTGQPKGVMGRHGPLTHFLPWLTETFGLADNDQFSFLSSLSTNKLQREIFTALALGATLHIPIDDAIGGFGMLDQWLRQKKISVIHLTPAMAQLLNDTARASVPSVRKVFFGGDLLQMRDVNLANNLMPRAEIINFYNSSETQRGGGYFAFSKSQAGNQKDIPPLGQGVKDVQLLVLNRTGAPAGVSELGEICVRSPHLALGYLGDEALTKERFIINPYSGQTGDRIYRTGELGRYLPNGNVEFVARGENQVSIRGYRVDLGEIESVLKRHANISNAVIVLHNGSADRLIAYLVPKSASILSIDEIRLFLRARLPNYMIPAAFVIRDSLPLTATGKIDRRLLAAVNLDKIDQQSMLVSPRNRMEESLAKIWENVLKLDKVGIHNNFFDLGGHSLLAIRVMSLIRQVFGVEVPLRAIFEAPTIAELAVTLTLHQTEQLPDPETAQILRDVETITEEEAQKILAR